MEPMDTAGLMDARQAGSYLGKSAHWVQVNRKRGLIPYTVLSPRRYAYKKADLDRWIEANSVDAGRIQKPALTRSIPKVFL